MPKSVNLIAGQHIDIGSVYVWNTKDYIFVRYEAEDNWYLSETHLAVATSLDGIPQTNSGNPIPGQFPYKTTHDPMVTHYTYKISLKEVGYNETTQDLFIAAHADVKLLDENNTIIQEETAWGEGQNFPGHNWAMYFIYSVCNYNNPVLSQSFTQIRKL